MSRAKNLVAMTGDMGDLDQKVKGYLTFYCVRSPRKRQEEVRELWRINELPERILPPEIRPADAFRRATATIRKKRQEGVDEGTYINLFITEVLNNDDVIHRHVVKETVDSNNQRLCYGEVAILTLDKNTKEFKIQLKTSDEDVENVVEKARSLFEENCIFYGSNQIRGMIRSVLKECQATLLRDNGGVYFVPVQHKEMLFNLQRFIEVIGEDSQEKASRIDTLPAMDGPELKRLVIDMFNLQLLKEIEEMTQEIREQSSRDKIRLATAQKYINAANTLIKDVRDYEKMFGFSMNPDIKNALTALSQQAESLIMAV